MPRLLVYGDSTVWAAPFVDPDWATDLYIQESSMRLTWSYLLFRRIVGASAQVTLTSLDGWGFPGTFNTVNPECRHMVSDNGWELINSGVGGITTANMLRDLNANVRSYNPDIVLLFGSNNETGTASVGQAAADRVLQMANTLRSDGATVHLCTIGGYPAARTTLEAENARIRTHAADNGYNLLDVYTALRNPDFSVKSVSYFDQYLLHYTADGNIAVADFFDVQFIIPPEPSASGFSLVTESDEVPLSLTLYNGTTEVPLTVDWT